MTRKNKILLAAGCCAAAALVAVGVLRGLARTPHDSTTYAMSTIVTQRAYGLQAEQAMRQVESTLREFEGRLSLFDQDSEIAAINAAAGDHPVRVSAATFGLLRQSLALSATSEGAFDITIAPLTQLWGITTDHPRVPTQQEIDGALALVGDAEVQLDQQASTVFLPRAGQAIDLGGIAKGNACVLAQRIYEDCGVKSAVLSIGGNVYVRGRNPDGEQFRVGFRTPKRADESYIASVALENQVMAVSGGYERYFEEGGVRYHHILSSETGYPAQSDIVSVGVICEDGTRADFLSTTLFVWGTEKTREFMRSHDDVAVILLTEGDELLVSRSLQESFRLSEQGAGYRVTFI